MKIKTLLCAALTTLCATLLISQPVLAEEALPDVRIQISPVSSLVPLPASSSREYTFSVENTGAKTFSYKVYTTPYSIDTSTDEYQNSFSQETSYTQITRWISFKDINGQWKDTVTFRINPSEKQTITYRIQVPADVPAGGQYATIFSEALNDNVSAEGIRTISRVGLVVYGHSIGDTVLNAQITDLDLSRFLTKGNIGGSARIKNEGNVDFTATHTFTVKTLFGKTLYEQDIVSSVLPETERVIREEWENTPFMGFFAVTYRIVAVDQMEEQTNVVLIMPVLMIIILLILLTGFIIWAIMLNRRRRERRSRLVM